MTRRLAGFMIDCQQGNLAEASHFWSQALGQPVVDPDEGGAGRYAVLAPTSGGWHVEVQMVAHASRLHLDIEADDIDAEAGRLEALGASRIDKPHGRWWVMQAPSGHRFCVVRWRERPATPAAASPADPAGAAVSAGRRGRLAALVIDCPTPSLEAPLEFWAAALDRGIASRDQDGDGRYAELETSDDEPYLLLQRVEHEPRVHLDLRSHDIESQARRLEALGASRVEFLRRWWVMQAPTGHRFCVVANPPG